MTVLESSILSEPYLVIASAIMSLRLKILKNSNYDGFLIDGNQRPALGLGNGPHFLDGYCITFVALVVRIMCVHLGRAGNVLAIHRMLHPTLNQHDDGFVHLVAHNPAGNDTAGFFYCNFARRHIQDPTFCFSVMMVLTRAISFLMLLLR